jgi:CheY-like chemotaxis protein
MTPAAKRPVVLVDDETSFLDLMKLLLGDHLDCPVHGFASPAEALAALPGLAPGVVVTDYNMPEIDGLTLVRRAAPLVPETAFVVLSGQNLAAAAERIARIPGVRGQLAKPLGWRKVAEEIIRVWPAGAGAAPVLRA